MIEEEQTRPRKRPQQERSRALVAAVIEATARVLADEGLDAVNTNRVAEVAGVSIGSLYQYYPNREALLAALIERELDEDMAQARQLAESWRDAPLAELMAAMVDGMLATLSGREVLHERLLPLVGDLHRAELVAQRREEMGAMMLEILAEHRDELPARLRDAEPRRASAFVAMRAMELTFNAAKIEAPELLERPGFREDLLRIMRAVLLEP